MSERDETREAVARAIWDSPLLQPARGDWAGNNSATEQCCRRAADAALATLKPGSRFTVEGVECVVVRADPTEAMMAAGLKEGDILGELVDWRGPDTATREDIARVYRAMLRACEEKG